jgi:hypothetical protein
MIRKELTYKNLFGDEVTKELYFHFTLAELVEMEASEGEALSARLLSIDRQNGAQILKTFKDLVQQAYGVRTPDGEFEKDSDEAAKFIKSQAFDELLAELMKDPKLAAEFVNGLFPADLQKTAAEIAAASGDDLQEKIDAAVAEASKQGRTLESVEVRDLNLIQLQDNQSGLAHPRDKENKLLPWAFRAPTDAELTRMNRALLMEVMARQSKGWTPPPQITDVKPV